MTTKTPLKVIYIGARVVGRRCLAAMLSTDAEVVGLLYLDDALAGVTVAHESFDDLITHHRLCAKSFRSLRDPELVAWVEMLQPDVGVVIGVSQLIDEALLQVPRLGFIGMHPTLLPEGRGRAPIPWALIKGLERTGVSLFWCEPGADTGPLLDQREVPIYYEDSAAILGARTDVVAAELLIKAASELPCGEVRRVPQDESKATTWPKRLPEDGLIDWTWTGRRIYDWVRALSHPYPGAFAEVEGQRLNVWACRETGDHRTGAPGTILEVLPHGLLVACGEGAVLLTEVEWEGMSSTATALAEDVVERILITTHNNG